MMELTSFTDQCCDAKHYTVIGEMCAWNNDCYNDLRPVGASLWFSLPLRLGLPMASLLYFNLVLIAISTALATTAALRIFTGPPRIPVVWPILFATITLGIHLLWLWPVIGNTLSDAPAALFTAIGFWMLLLRPTSTRNRILSYLLAGICLGLGAWIRAFFVYPVYGLCAIIMLQWLLDRKRTHALPVLVALLPIAAQYIINWNHTGSISYVEPHREQQQFTDMMTDPAIGYDTMIPGNSYIWYSGCNRIQPLGEALHHIDVRSLACLFGGKLYFYLGSYSATTYWYPEKQLAPLNRHTIDMLANSYTALHPVTTRNAKMTFQQHGKTMADIKRINNQEDVRIDVPASVSFQHKYRFTISASGEGNNQLLSVRVTPVDAEYAVEKKILLQPYPETMELEFFNIDPGPSEYVFSIVYPAATSEIGKAAHQRGIEINRSNTLTINALGMEDRDPGALRHWSPALLLANVIVLLLASRLLYLAGKPADSAGFALLVFPLLCLAEAMLVMPEQQRYIIAPLLILWVTGARWLIDRRL